MLSIGSPELFAIVPIAVTCLLFCGVVWKFYKMLSKMNDHLAGIRRAVESASLLRL